MKKIILFISLCATMFLFVACDNEGRVQRQRPKLQVQESSDGIEILGPDGRVLIKGNGKEASIIIMTNDGNEETYEISTDKLASGFPDDIPILPDSTVTMNQVFKDGQNAIATLSSSEKATAVIQFYEEQIPLKGWEPGERFNLDNIVMLNGTRGKASLNISITSAETTTTINIARTKSTD